MINHIELLAQKMERQGELTVATNLRTLLAQNEQLKTQLDRKTPAAYWREEASKDPHGERYDCERHELCGGDQTDCELANSVFLVPHIGNLTAAKDRIRWLSRRCENLEKSNLLKNEPVIIEFINKFGTRCGDIIEIDVNDLPKGNYKLNSEGAAK